MNPSYKQQYLYIFPKFKPSIQISNQNPKQKLFFDDKMSSNRRSDKQEWQR